MYIYIYIYIYIYKYMFTCTDSSRGNRKRGGGLPSLIRHAEERVERKDSQMLSEDIGSRIEVVRLDGSVLGLFDTGT